MRVLSVYKVLSNIDVEARVIISSSYGIIWTIAKEFSVRHTSFTRSYFQMPFA